MRLNFVKPLPEIRMIKILLQQILSNLLVNAVNYCDKPHCEITIDYHVLLNQIELIVEDSGIGMNTDECQNIFRLFYIGGNSEKLAGFSCC